MTTFDDTCRALRYAPVPDGGGWVIWDRKENRPVRAGSAVRRFTSRDDATGWLLERSDAGCGPAWETVRVPLGHRDGWGSRFGDGG